MRVMVGVIILYDHVHPVGAFAKTSKIDVSDTLVSIDGALPSKGAREENHEAVKPEMGSAMGPTGIGLVVSRSGPASHPLDQGRVREKMLHLHPGSIGSSWLDEPITCSRARIPPALLPLSNEVLVSVRYARGDIQQSHA